MTTATRRDRLLILLLLLAASGAMAVSNYAPVRLGTPPALTLPERVGTYTGIRQRFCQNERCLATLTLTAPETTLPERCPSCGGQLDDVTLAENRILPSDTTILKRIYENSAGQFMAVSVVISGSEQRSIHRPQQCLPAQGYKILGGRTHRIQNMPGRPPLDIRILDTGASQRLPNGRLSEYNAAYAYWFASATRETPYHLERLAWMGYDRLRHGIAPRWAYVAIATHRTAGTQHHIERLERFIAELYPLMTMPTPAPPPPAQ